MKISAIPTKYKGIEFRSRIEARWAIVFDEMGLDWEYEKEGYDLDGVWYLPDFFFPKLKTWIEIKGEDPTKEEREKCMFLSGRLHQVVWLFYGSIPNGERGFVDNAECFRIPIFAQDREYDFSQSFFFEALMINGSDSEIFKKESEIVSSYDRACDKARSYKF